MTLPRITARPGALLIATVLTGALLAGAAPRAAMAQLAVDRVELTLRPGGTLEERVGLITVRNDGAKAVQATVQLEDWDRAEDGTNRWFAIGTIPQSCGHALRVFPLALSLEPGASGSVRVTLDSTASARECWAAVVVETVQPQTVAGRSVAYVLRTAVKLYALPAGLTTDGVVADMRVGAKAPAPGVRDSSKHLDVMFENTGTRHVMAKGTVELRRPDNSVAAKVELPDMYALPGAKSRASVALPKLPPGRYVVLALLDYGGDDIAAAQIEYEVR